MHKQMHTHIHIHTGNTHLRARTRSRISTRTHSFSHTHTRTHIYIWFGYDTNRVVTMANFLFSANDGWNTHIIWLTHVCIRYQNVSQKISLGFKNVVLFNLCKARTKYVHHLAHICVCIGRQNVSQNVSLGGSECRMEWLWLVSSLKV